MTKYIYTVWDIYLQYGTSIYSMGHLSTVWGIYLCIGYFISWWLAIGKFISWWWRFWSGIPWPYLIAPDHYGEVLPFCSPPPPFYKPQIHTDGVPYWDRSIFMRCTWPTCFMFSKNRKVSPLGSSLTLSHTLSLAHPTLTFLPSSLSHSRLARPLHPHCIPPSSSRSPLANLGFSIPVPPLPASS